jgi:hypothetical protein
MKLRDERINQMQPGLDIGQDTEANGRGALSDWPCALKNSFHIFHLPMPCPAEMALKMGALQFSYVMSSPVQRPVPSVKHLGQKILASHYLWSSCLVKGMNTPWKWKPWHYYGKIIQWMWLICVDVSEIRIQIQQRNFLPFDMFQSSTLKYKWTVSVIINQGNQHQFKFLFHGSQLCYIPINLLLSGIGGLWAHSMIFFCFTLI